MESDIIKRVDDLIITYNNVVKGVDKKAMLEKD